MSVVEQIEVVVLIIHGHPFLPGDEGEVGAQFQDEGFQLPQDRTLDVLLIVSAAQSEEVEQVRVAEGQIGRHPVLVP